MRDRVIIMFIWQVTKYTSGTESSNMGISGRSPDSGMEIFGYDAFNRLISYNSGSSEATYTYDADNLRASKTVDREKTTFVWNGSNLASETTDSVVNTYTYDATGVYIANQDSTVTSYLKDFHGNVVGKTDTSGEMIEEMNNRMDYDSYGNQWIGDTPDPFGYCGEYYDTESGLIYLRNRYYESETGRFITEDPAQDGTNWYSYCAGNPVVLVDPSGKIKETDKIYGENSTVYKSLVYLGDAWTLFPENRSDIEELANEVRYLANADGAQNIDSILKGLRKVGQLPENLNYVEQVLIAGYPIDAAIMNSARNKADEATWNIFGEEGNGDGESNAFKHAYWNATASSKIGEKKTRLFANAHEFGWAWENAADATPIKMDLHNNEAGRKVGSSNLYSGDIETGILSYLMSGRLWKIENGQLVKTNGNARF